MISALSLHTEPFADMVRAPDDDETSSSTVLRTLAAEHRLFALLAGCCARAGAGAGSRAEARARAPTRGEACHGERSRSQLLSQ